MPIDLEVQHLLDYYHSLKLPSYDESTKVDEVRKLMKAFSEQASSELSPNIKEIRDHTFSTSIKDVLVRTYIPKNNIYKKPLIFFRSSGFVIDNFSDSDVFCSKLASHCGTTVLSIDYPLAPEHPFPEPLVACYETILKIVSDADVFGMDPSGFVMIGESTGGMIAASLAQMLRDKNGPTIGSMVLLYPPLDNDFTTESYKTMGSGYILTEDKMRWYFSKYFENEKEVQKPYAFPLAASDFSNLPKTLIVSAQYDPLSDDAKKYEKALKDANVPCEHICYKDLIHGFLKFSGFPASENAFLDLIKKIKHFLQVESA